MITRSDEWYMQEGRYYPRLTKILGIIREPELDKWKVRVGDAVAIKQANQAAKVGTTVHKMIQDSIMMGKMAKPSAKASVQVLGAWNGFKAWTQLMGGLPKGTCEEMIVSDTYGYGATLDFSEQDRLTEWKVTSRIRPSHWIQLMAGAMLKWDDPTGKMVRVVRLDAELGTYQVQEKPFSHSIFQTFLHLAAVYRAWYFQPMITEMMNVKQVEEE